MVKFLQCRGCGGDHQIKWTRKRKKLCLLACVEGENRESCKNRVSKARHRNFTEKQEELIMTLHRVLGNKWSLIAREVPGKRAEDIRNLCRRKHMKKKLQSINDEPEVAFVNEAKNSDEDKGTRLDMIDLNELPNGEEYIEDFGCKNPLISFDLNQIPPEAEVIII